MVEKTIVADIVKNIRKTKMNFREFFISYNGVPTLAYTGFTPPLLTLKENLNSRLPGLREENDGSKWPKTTLGALRDDRTLSWNDLVTLRNICDTSNLLLKGLNLKIDNLSIVLFHCRSLERRISTEIIQMAGPLDSSNPSQKELDGITKIMDQFDRKNLVEYFPKVQNKGNRESHYRAPFFEATLVHDLKLVPDPISHFRSEVEKKLPGMYCWFEADSLHMTVRALA